MPMISRKRLERLTSEGFKILFLENLKSLRDIPSGCEHKLGGTSKF